MEEEGLKTSGVCERRRGRLSEKRCITKANRKYHNAREQFQKKVMGENSNGNASISVSDRYTIDIIFWLLW